MLSDEQAEPEWTATPARSSPMSTGSASTPSHAEADQVGSLASGAGPDDRRPPRPPARRRRRSAICRRRRRAPPFRSAGALRRPAPRRRRRRRGGRAVPRSPARRPRSCSPPTRRGSNRLPRRTISAPAPGTPPSLCALMLTRSASSAARSMGTWPQAAAASTWTVTPASRHSATTSCTGWSVPTSWLPHWQCTSAGRGRDPDRRRSRRASTSSRPAAVHRDLLGRRQTGRRVADRRVLHGGAEDGRAGLGPGGPPDGGVDGLGRPGGEDDLAPRHAHELGHLARGPPRARRGRSDPLRAAGRGRPSGRAAHCASAASASGRGGVVLAWSR